MMSSEDIRHERLKELGALAALGQISADEYREWKEHWADCQECGSLHQDFEEILHAHLPLMASSKPLLVADREFRHTPKDYLHRFLRRAREEGIHIDFPSPIPIPAASNWLRGLRAWKWNWQPQFLAYGTAALVCVLSLGFLAHQWQSSYIDKSSTEAEIAKLHAQIAALKTSHTESNHHEGTPLVNKSAAGSANESELRARLYKTQREYERTQARLKTYEQKSQQMDLTIANLQQELGEAKNKAIDAEKVPETELALRLANDELHRLRQVRTAEAGLLSSQQSQLQDLSARVNAQAMTIEQQRALLDVGSDVRDMMLARNVRQIDIEDVDSTGNSSASQRIGRVFLTENKLLIVAFNLNRKKLPANLCYQVWGQKEGKPGQPYNLGILNLDDERQNRWILKFEGPKVLAEIDSIFTTPEPKGGSPRPSGQKLMYGFLVR
jgi:hypothetical protein